MEGTENSDEQLNGRKSARRVEQVDALLADAPAQGRSRQVVARRAGQQDLGFTARLDIEKRRAQAHLVVRLAFDVGAPCWLLNVLTRVFR